MPALPLCLVLALCRWCRSPWEERSAGWPYSAAACRDSRAGDPDTWRPWRVGEPDTWRARVSRMVTWCGCGRWRRGEEGEPNTEMCNYVISAARVTADRRGGENNELEQQREPGTCQFLLRLFKKAYLFFYCGVCCCSALPPRLLSEDIIGQREKCFIVLMLRNSDNFHQMLDCNLNYCNCPLIKLDLWTHVADSCATPAASPFARGPAAAP